MAKEKEVDVLKKKQAELTMYNSQFDQAVSLVTTTVKRLCAINENIDAKIREIDEYQTELENTKNGLSNAKLKNESVIKNFSALLNVD